MFQKLIASTVVAVLSVTTQVAIAKEKSEIAEKPHKEAKAVNLSPKDTRTYSQKEQDRSAAQAAKGGEILRQEKVKEQMRDKTHDNRIPVGKGASVGVQGDPPGVNIRKSIP